MDSGLLGIPFLLYSAVDRVIAGVLGSAGTVIVLSLTCSVIVMLLYRLCSPQAELKRIKLRMREIQAALLADPDDLRAVLRLSGENIRIALKRFLFTVLPTCIAILPLLSVTSWINSRYGAAFPSSGEVVAVQVIPGDVSILSPAPDGVAFMTNAVAVAAGSFSVLDESQSLLVTVRDSMSSSFIARKVWWNVLMGNPLGYLSPDSDIEALVFDVKRQNVLPFGPDWMRRWEALFFVCMALGSFSLKIFLKVE